MTSTTTPYAEDFAKSFYPVTKEFEIKMVDLDDSYDPIQYEELPIQFKNEIDEFAAELLDRDLGRIIIIGSSQSGKTFLIHQLVGNIDRYLDKLKLSKMHFIRIDHDDLESINALPNKYSDYVKAVMQSLHCSEKELCFVMEDPEIAAKFYTFTKKARIILEASQSTFMSMVNHESHGGAKLWASWGVIEADDITLKRKDLVNLIHEILHDRIQETFKIDLTKKTINMFITRVLNSIPSLVLPDKTIAVPVGVWAITIRRMCGVLGLSESPAIYKDGEIILRRVIAKTFEDNSSRFESYIPEDDDRTLIINTPFGTAQISLSEASNLGLAFNEESEKDEKEAQNAVEKISFKNIDDVNIMLKKEVIGQDESIDALTDGLIVPAAGLHDDTKPLRSLLFLGPTGVGKTKLATTLAKDLGKNPMEVVRIDMSEYSQSHEAAKLLGAPPGYAGFEKGGVLTNAVKQNPQSLILLDEIEKAHPKIWDSFLQILDAGRMTDGMGNTVDFTQTIIVMTSNIGASELKTKSMGFSLMSEEEAFTKRQKDAKETVMKALEKELRPEMINRIDEIIVFKELSKDTARFIVRKEINIISARMKATGFELSEISNDIIDELLVKSNFSQYGARDIQRVVLKNVSHLIARKIVNPVDENKVITLTLDDSKNIAIAS